MTEETKEAFKRWYETKGRAKLSEKRRKRYQGLAYGSYLNEMQKLMKFQIEKLKELRVKREGQIARIDEAINRKETLLKEGRLK